MDKSGRYHSMSPLRHSEGKRPLSRDSVPDEPATELEQFARYRQSSSSQNGNAKTDGPCCLLCSYAAEEVRRKERIVEMDEAGGWMAVIPFWATWPFEIMRESLTGRFVEFGLK